MNIMRSEDRSEANGRKRWRRKRIVLVLGDVLAEHECPLSASKKGEEVVGGRGVDSVV